MANTTSQYYCVVCGFDTVEESEFIDHVTIHEERGEAQEL
jgi:hypothetical protein